MQVTAFSKSTITGDRNVMHPLLPTENEIRLGFKFKFVVELLGKTLFLRSCKQVALPRALRVTFLLSSRELWIKKWGSLKYFVCHKNFPQFFSHFFLLRLGHNIVLYNTAER